MPTHQLSSYFPLEALSRRRFDYSKCNMERAKTPTRAVTQNPPAPTAPQFAFLELPSELRLYTYRLLFQRNSVVWLTGHRAHHCVGDRVETGLLSICRKIYNEASPVLYDTNRFAVNGLAGSQYVLGKLSTQACSHLKSLRIWSIPLDFDDLQRAIPPEGPLVVHVPALPAPPINSSIWNCVSHHLQNLETIEIGILGDDFFLAISRLTSTTRLVKKTRLPPTIDLEIWVSGSLHSRIPGRPGHPHDAIFRKDKNKTRLWLPSVDSIRIIGRLNPRDCKYLQGDVYQYYRVAKVEELYPTEFHSTYGDHSAVLVSLEMRANRWD